MLRICRGAAAEAQIEHCDIYKMSFVWVPGYACVAAAEFRLHANCSVPLLLGGYSWRAALPALRGAVFL